MAEPTSPSAATVRPCPICRKPAPWQGNPYRPFCSERCQVQDQAGWAAEKYTVPAHEQTPSEDGEKEK